MFLRFAIGKIDEDSKRPQGLFVAAYELLDSGALDQTEWARVREILIWFNQHLLHQPKEFSAGRAIFWFKSKKPNARECIHQMWVLVGVMREHGYYIEVHKCPTLENICYEDDLQVAAYPSASDSRTKVS